MEAQIIDLKKKFEENLNNTISFLNKELIKIRTGKAHPSLFDGIKIDYYGNPTPLNQMASINIPDAKTIVIQPWDKSVLSFIEKAILNANLGFTPINNGEIIRINIPQLTEERRKEYVKLAKMEGEKAKVSVRNIRREYLEKLKKLEKEGVPEDEIKKSEKEFQDIVDNTMKQIDNLIELKEKEILQI
ncbi:MAG TPA: ribosome recycling factor [Bacteroidales bacterium]|jgi:ribosome recycling factor|nr:MAG: Ribosome-recycling factor [Bacteroidetes bacterium ADurb.Bin035]HCM29222.1 ribosome recycling factor [Bacteroidales bacterium]HNQ19682.1 ribosome recycling factor [Bacteroidales bacterium]HOC39924.1 ribosome recycling factor [Bacteroidales bacterium]HOF06759.1 ribosome recycling factor [Bacteroidales bacterium]